MYKKRNIILLLSLSGLITLLFIIYSIGENDNPGRIDQTIYRLDNLAEIDEIRLTSEDSHIVLKYNNVRWRVNDKYNADNQLITVLFATLEKAAPRQLIAHTYSDSVRQEVYTHGVSVTLFKDGKKIKEFYTGGDKKKTKTYFQDSKNGPHLVTIPGYHVYVSGIFEVRALGWRSRRIFDFNWQNFKKLSAVFMDHKNSGFEIENLGSEFNITTLAKTDTAKLNNYLDAVSLLTADRFIPTGFSERYDSLAQAPPLAQIKVEDGSHTQYRLSLYPPLSGDKNILGKKDKNTMALFSRKEMFPILKTKNYFIPK